jgi:hypothetical protein
MNLDPTEAERVDQRQGTMIVATAAAGSALILGIVVAAIVSVIRMLGGMFS